MKRGISLFFVFTPFVFAAFAGVVHSYDCPYGRVDDPYPGSCSLYVDENNDNICDNSQELAAASDSTPSGEQNTQQKNAGSASKDYNTIELMAAFLIFQLLGISLVDYEKISVLKWRRVNNWILLFSFLVMFFTSIALLLSIEFGISFGKLGNIRNLHVISGIVMVLFSLEHVVRRWRCFF